MVSTINSKMLPSIFVARIRDLCIIRTKIEKYTFFFNFTLYYLILC